MRSAFDENIRNIERRWNAVAALCRAWDIDPDSIGIVHDEPVATVGIEVDGVVVLHTLSLVPTERVQSR
jgi:hypothetical protein